MEKRSTNLRNDDPMHIHIQVENHTLPHQFYFINKHGWGGKERKHSFKQNELTYSIPPKDG